MTTGASARAIRPPRPRRLKRSLIGIWTASRNVPGLPDLLGLGPIGRPQHPGSVPPARLH